MNNATLLLLHMFADQNRPLREWSQATRRAAFSCFLDGIGSPEQHAQMMENIDKVIEIVEEYDPPSIK